MKYCARQKRTRRSFSGWSWTDDCQTKQEKSPYYCGRSKGICQPKEHACCQKYRKAPEINCLRPLCSDDFSCRKREHLGQAAKMDAPKEQRHNYAPRDQKAARRKKCNFYRKGNKIRVQGKARHN